jgi:signal recognition particle GTPase
MLVAADVYRPAAIDQLTILGKKVHLVNLSFPLQY